MNTIEKQKPAGFTGPVPAFALLVGAFAATKLAIHLLTATGYGYFGDEFYAIAMSKHLAFGYVDLPPLAPFLAAVSRALLGESLFAFRISPALAGAATLVFVCLITRELGGKLFATALSALGFLVAPMWLIVDSFFCYDSINQLALAVFLYFLVRYLRTENKRLWIGIGLTAGIAFMTKATIIISGPGMLVALLATKHRKDLLTPWPWIAVGLFALVISPWVIWQFANHWPTVEYWSVHARAFYKYSIAEYFVNISLMMNPMLMPLLGVGLYRIFRRFADTSYGLLGIMFLVTMVVVGWFHYRVFELAHLFVPLLCAGAVFIEEKLADLRLRNVLGAVGISSLLAAGIVEAPLCLPILPLDKLPAYSAAMAPLFRPVKDYNFEKSAYPQELSMKIGWEEMVQKVALVYNGLPEEDRKKAVIWASFFTAAGAIDVLGPRYGLPNAVSGHLNYFLWGPGDKPWDVVIAVSPNLDMMRGCYWNVEIKEFVASNFSMVFNRYFVAVCRGRMYGTSKDAIWARLKYYW